MPALAFYISGHGFGHASRDIEVINAFARRRPDVRVLVRTSAQRWLFDLTLKAPVSFHHVECDTGVVQIDSLHLDEDATIRRAAAFHATLDARAEEEAQFLRAADVSLAVGDIPPLAMAAAEQAGIPGIALGNFTWDWIYAGYPDAIAAAPGLLDTIRRAYRTATLALRLPMFGGFEVFGPRVRDVPFIARRSTLPRDAARHAFGISRDKPAVLVSFGGYGLPSLQELDFARIPQYTFVVTSAPGHPEPGGAESLVSGGNVVAVDEAAIYQRGLRYEDLVAASDIVATKPGYGIIAECIANGTAILYTSRGHFVEYDVLVAAMPRYLRSAFIGHDDLFSGNWMPFLDRVMKQPAPAERPATDGADVVAGVLADYI